MGNVRIAALGFDVRRAAEDLAAALLEATALLGGGAGRVERVAAAGRRRHSWLGATAQRGARSSWRIAPAPLSVRSLR